MKNNNLLKKQRPLISCKKDRAQLASIMNKEK